MNKSEHRHQSIHAPSFQKTKSIHKLNYVLLAENDIQWRTRDINHEPFKSAKSDNFTAAAHSKWKNVWKLHGRCSVMLRPVQQFKLFWKLYPV